MSIFHLAVPTHDIALSKAFYTEALGAKIGREYDNYVIFDFFGHQLVAHLHPDLIEKDVKMYPRHHGIIMTNREDFDRTYELCKKAKAPFFEDLFERFQNQKGWHYSFFVSDPSNNLVEFKYYVNEQDIFG